MLFTELNSTNYESISTRSKPVKKTYSIRTMDFAVFLKQQQKDSVDLMLTDPPYAISRKTGWWALLAIILPLISFVLWFIPGTQGENKYGPDPLSTADEKKQ